MYDGRYLYDYFLVDMKKPAHVPGVDNSEELVATGKAGSNKNILLEESNVKAEKQFLPYLVEMIPSSWDKNSRNKYGKSLLGDDTKK